MILKEIGCMHEEVDVDLATVLALEYRGFVGMPIDYLLRVRKPNRRRR